MSAIHVGLAQLVLLAPHAGLGVHLGLADRALLLLDGDLGVELALADGALLFDREIAPGEDRLVGVACRIASRASASSALAVSGVGLIAADRHAEDFEAERGDLGATPQAGRDAVGDAVGCLQRLLQGQRLDRLLRQHLDRAEDALRQLLGIVGLVVLPSRLQREVEHARRPSLDRRCGR